MEEINKAGESIFLIRIVYRVEIVEWFLFWSVDWNIFDKENLKIGFLNKGWTLPIFTTGCHYCFQWQTVADSGKNWKCPGLDFEVEKVKGNFYKNQF